MRLYSTRVLIALAALAVGIGLIVFIAQARSSDDGSARIATNDRPVDPLSAEQYARQAADADPNTVMHLIQAGNDEVWSCASCHGDRGQGSSTVPRLAGLPAGYLVKQLHDFAPGDRVNSNMAYVVDGLTDTQMAALGRYYADLEAPSNTQPALGGDLERGRELALQGDWSVDVPSCLSCHGSSGWGVDPIFPALAAQHPEYIYRQLVNWTNGRRSNSPVRLMRVIANKLSDDDMRAVADYLSTLTPPQKLRTADQNDSDGR